MQNAGQYVAGTANAHQTQQFVPSEPSPTGGSTTSSLRQFRKRDVDKSQLEQSPKQESHVARVAPHNHYPPVSNDIYRYPPHQFSEYSPQVKYSDIADPTQLNPISTSVIHKPKPKDYMEMCNVQQQHLNSQQQYSPDNGQYMHRDPAQGYPTGYKPEAHYIPKDQPQYQQLGHHAGQPKFNPMMTQNMRKYNPSPADNPFLNKLSKMHPSMARSIISDHHLQEPQPSYSPMDQRAMYGQQNHRYYTSSLHQPNPYVPNPNFSMNPTHHYPNYPAGNYSYTRTPTIAPRYSHMERSMSPTRRGYPENMNISHPTYHNMPQKMSTGHNYPPQYAGSPEYAQHYQHRRLAAQDFYSQSCRPTQYMQNHHQIPAQEMQELPENRISPSESLKKFIENWDAGEEPSGEMNPMESNMNLRENVKVRDDAPPGTVYMINATDVQYFENNGIPIVTSDNGGIQLTSENYQYLLKNGLVDNTGMVRIIEANKEPSIDASGNHERIVNLQIMETSKSDCMMVSKTMRSGESSIANGMITKTDEDNNRRVVIHQNTVISPGNNTVSDRIPSQQLQCQAPSQNVGSISISKELVDKNCSPINLDQLEHNLGFSEPEPPETEINRNQNSSIPVSTIDCNITESSNPGNPKPEVSLSEDLSQNSDDSQNKSPESKSMPIIDLFGDSHAEENSSETHSQKKLNNEGNIQLSDQNFKNSNENLDLPEKTDYKENVKEHLTNDETIPDQMLQDKQQQQIEVPKLDPAPTLKNHGISNNDALESTTPTSSVIVTPESLRKDIVPKEEAKYFENSESEKEDQKVAIAQTSDEEMDSVNSSESSKYMECKELLAIEELPIQTKTELKSENIDTENKTKTVELTSVERRKRIFSVDDIIHHIGNNIKRGSKELVVDCSANTVCAFIEKEVEFSSLEQVLNMYHLHGTNKSILDEQTLSTEIANADKQENSNKPPAISKQDVNVEDTKDLTSENVSYSQKSGALEVPDNRQVTLIESESFLDLEDTGSITESQDKELIGNEEEFKHEKSLDEELVNDKEETGINAKSLDKEVIRGNEDYKNDDEELVNDKEEIGINTKSLDKELISEKEDYKILEMDDEVTRQAEVKVNDLLENESIRDKKVKTLIISDPVTVPVLLQLDDRCSTPYQNDKINDEKIETQQDGKIESTEHSQQISTASETVPVMLEPGDRCSTPCIFQYHNDKINDKENETTQDVKVESPEESQQINFDPEPVPVIYKPGSRCSTPGVFEYQNNQINDKDDETIQEVELAEQSQQLSSDPEIVPVTLESDDRSSTPAKFQYKNNNINDKKNETKQEEKVNLTDQGQEISSDPVTVPVMLQPDGRCSTPDVFQYQNDKINDKKEETKQGEKMESTETSADPVNLPVTLDEPDERSNTPSMFQYRNVIRVEETSVLLQISGELMEISVNIVNSKKVITVSPLSDTTVVDYNDNYEASAVVQDTDALQINDGGLESEKMNIVEDDKGEGNSAVSENQIEVTSKKEITDELNNQGKEITGLETKDNASHPEEHIDQPSKNLKVNKFISLQNEVEVQENFGDVVSVNINKPLAITEHGTVIDHLTNNQDQIDNAERLKESVTCDDVPETEIVLPETPKAEPSEIIEPDESFDISLQLPEDIEANDLKDFNSEEVVTSFNDSTDLVESSGTTKDLENITAFENSEPENPEDAKNATDLITSNQDSFDIDTIGNDIIVQEAEESYDFSDGIQNYLPKTTIDHSQENDYTEEIPEIDKRFPLTGAEEEVHFYSHEPFHYNEAIEQGSGTDIEGECVDYQLEDDVFVSEEPPHEIIIGDPLEDVGLVEEIDRTSDNVDIPLEPVIASDETVAISQLSFTENLESDDINKCNGNQNENPVTQKENINDQLNEKLDEIKTSISTKEKPVSAYKQDETIKKLVCNTSNEEISIIRTERVRKEPMKPEIQILSPTSTNIEDHITTSKENIYLEPRRRNTDDSESASVAVTTKAAKKLYECDLQIPAVTTSGDVSTKVSKKSTKDMHDTVSSSKKERIIKELPKIKKSSLKRSKRINEKNKIKNDQQEMLRMLAEKRKQRQEVKQKDAMRQKEDDKNAEEYKGIEENINMASEIEEAEETEEKHSTENEEEYVDFKELLRARKLRKLKMQEMKRKEAKENKIKMEENNKNAAKAGSKAANKKGVKANKSVAVNNVPEKEAETPKKCCIGCSAPIKKSEKNGSQGSKKGRNSSNNKDNETKSVKPKNQNSSIKQSKNSTSDVVDAKLNTDATFDESNSENSDTKTKAELVDDKSNSKINLPMKGKKSLPSTISTKVNIEEKIVSQIPNLETPAENQEVPNEVKLKKRGSFGGDITTSPLNNENHSISVNEGIATSVVRINPALKDPRRRSTSYASHVMVPSVSELLEENSGAVYKKKISLADYVSRKRKASTETYDRSKPEEKDCNNKKFKFDDSAYENEEDEEVPDNYASEEGNTPCKRTIKDVKTSFVIHSSDWEDSQSPTHITTESNKECLIDDFSGLISKSKKPVIDVNELTPLETLENPKDKKLQEYKDKVDSQLSSLNIQIPKNKPQILENKRSKFNLDPHGSPESSRIIRKFLSNEKITQSEMEKIKKIISYKRLMQHQKNARSPSKSPGSSSSTYSQSPACSGYEPTCLALKSPVGSGSVYSDSVPDPTYEIKNRLRPEADSRKMRLHLKKVNAKRKSQLEYDDGGSSSMYSGLSETRHKKSVDYSVINRLGKDGLPKIIFKRNRQSNISDDSQLVVALERIDNNWDMVKEKYNVTVTQMM